VDKKGVRKEIPANTGRSRLNLSGAIDVVSYNVVIQEDQTLNAGSTIRYKAVKEYLATAKIDLHFLPPYSPNLNPIERLWKWMKERVVYNTYYEHFEDFKEAILGFFEVLPTLGENSVLGQSLRSRVRDRFRAIGTPSS
jgi:hypothetical protein